LVIDGGIGVSLRNQFCHVLAVRRFASLGIGKRGEDEFFWIFIELLGGKVCKNYV